MRSQLYTCTWFDEDTNDILNNSRWNDRLIKIYLWDIFFLYTYLSIRTLLNFNNDNICKITIPTYYAYLILRVGWDFERAHNIIQSDSASMLTPFSSLVIQLLQHLRIFLLVKEGPVDDQTIYFQMKIPSFLL